MQIKDMKKVIMYDLMMLTDKTSRNWNYHYKLLKGNLIDLFKKYSGQRIRCGYTSCKNNKQEDDGYFCNLKEISLISYFSSDERERGDRMVCEQYKTRKGYAVKNL